MRRSLAIVGITGCVTLAATDAIAAGAWGGQDFFHIPISWCAVQGSPAASNPNILPIGSATPDTTTDAVLWRRHERPTDNIYTNQAGITFRSAINNVWTGLNFPIIVDPDTALGVQGDMRGEDVTAFGTEYNQMLNACHMAYNNLGRAGIGITAVNVNLFHDAMGNYVQVIGWGGCTRSVATGNCVAPFDGHIAVVDNRFLYPTVADRRWPPSPKDPTGDFQFTLTDPLDQEVGHELGHAISLQHRSDAMALMNPEQKDTDGDGNTDNIALDATEVTRVRSNAPTVPGVQIDPPEQIRSGDFVRTRIPDQIREHNIPPYLDLAAGDATLNKRTKRVRLGAQMFGVLPETANAQVWFLVDTDGPQSGLSAAQLNEIGTPETAFAGADLVVGAEIVDGKVRGSAWRIIDGRPQPIREIVFDIHRLVMEPHFSPVPGREPPRIAGGAIHDIVVAELPADPVAITLAKPFQMQIIVLNAARQVTDKLDETPEERGVKFVLEDPAFAMCFVQGKGTPGDTVKVKLQGLIPSKGIHGLLGPREVFKGTADAAGGGMIDFPIPADASPGFHLVTIGTDSTALTADCVVDVVTGRPGRPVGSRELSLLKSYEDLIHGQQKLLHQFGKVVRETISVHQVSDQEALALTKQYQQMLKQQADLVARFGDLVREIAR
jgi:hypothetical protein